VLYLDARPRYSSGQKNTIRVPGYPVARPRIEPNIDAPTCFISMFNSSKIRDGKIKREKYIKKSIHEGKVR
jgi:hypothetical protein